MINKNLTLIGLMLISSLGVFSQKTELIIPVKPKATRTIPFVTWHPTQKMIAYSGDRVELWHVEKGLLRTLKTEFIARKVDFSPDGNLIALESDVGSIDIYSTKDGALVKKLEDNPLGEPFFHPNGKWLYVCMGYDNGTLRSKIDKYARGKSKVYDIQTWSMIKTLPGYFPPTTKVSPNGKYMGGPTIYNTSTLEKVKSVYKGTSESIIGIAYNPVKDQAAVMETEGGKLVVEIHDLSSKQLLYKWNVPWGNDDELYGAGNRSNFSAPYQNDISYSGDGEFLFVGGAYVNGYVLMKPNTGKIIQSVQGQAKSGETLGNVVYSPAFNLAFDVKNLVMHDVASGKIHSKLEEHYAKIEKTERTLSTIKDDHLFLAQDQFKGRDTRIWNLKNGDYWAYSYQPKSFTRPGSKRILKERSTGLQINPSTKQLLLSTGFSGQNRLKVYDYRTKRTIGEYTLGDNEILEDVAEQGPYLTTSLGDGRDKKVRYFKFYPAIGQPSKFNIVPIRASGPESDNEVYSKSHYGTNIHAYVSKDGKFIYVSKERSGKKDITEVYSTENGQYLKTIDGVIQHIGPSGKYMVYSVEEAPYTGRQQYSMKVLDPITGEVIFKDVGRLGTIALSRGGKYMVGTVSAGIGVVDMVNKKLISSAVMPFPPSMIKLSENDRFIIEYTSLDINPINVRELTSGELKISIYPLENGEWVATTPDGFFDGTPEGMKQLYYVAGFEKIPLDNLYEQFYTPNLISRVYNGETIDGAGVNIDQLTPPPLVKILNPVPGNSPTQQVTVSIQATDQGGGIDEIRLYHNGKLVNNTQRGFMNNGQTEHFTITLVNGQNRLKAIAFNDQRTESNPDEIIVTYKGGQATSDLHLLVVGINQYRNPKYNLNYAITDADAFKSSIEKGASNIFRNVNSIYIKDTDANKGNIINALESIKAKAGPEDMFVFYYAGHGVMNEGIDYEKDFYIVPYDVTRLYGSDEVLIQKAISSQEITALSKDISAQKQLFILDACQSGGALQQMASRGAAEEKAIAQLARSTGTYWITASGSEQFATEFQQLGHGVFTYAVLEGLSGKADGSSNDGKITAKELGAFIEDRVPELTEQYKGQAQFPMSYGFGQDFPIVISE